MREGGRPQHSKSWLIATEKIDSNIKPNGKKMLALADSGFLAY